MLMASGVSHDHPLLLIGLSPANVATLLTGETVTVDTAEISEDLPDLRVILTGGDEDTVIEALKASGLIDERTRRVDVPAER